MGDPKKIRRKFERPKGIWNRERIEREHGLVEKYGLKNLRELWKATTEVSRIRRNVREVLAGRVNEHVGTDIIARLAKYNIIGREAKLDDLLALSPEAILNRRLQSVVVKKGLARTPGQARQLIAHGFISVEGRRVRSPGYLVEGDEESKVGYYRSISLEPHDPRKPPTSGPAQAPNAEASASPEPKQQVEAVQKSE